jgi:dCTP deaminase
MNPDPYDADEYPLAGLPGLLCDTEITERVNLPDAHPMRLRIAPYHAEQVKTLTDGSTKCIGYGLTCFGYDVRLGLKFRRMRRDRNALHPKPISPFTPVDEVWHPVEEVREGGRFVIPPHDCVLAETLEVIRVPEDVGVLVLCKSTWARMFLNLNTTPLEPGWQGTVTLELHNQTPRHLEVFAGHGVGQLWFFRGKAPAVPYNKRAAPTYQNQTDPTPARV